MAATTIAGLPANKRSHASAKFRATETARLVSAASGWVLGLQMLPTEFAARFIGRHVQSPVVHHLREAAARVANARNNADMRAATDALAAGMLEIGLGRWTRELAELASQADTEGAVLRAERYRFEVTVSNAPYKTAAINYNPIDVSMSPAAIAVHICDARYLQGQPWEIADKISETIDTDASLRRLLFEPMTLEGIMDLYPNMLTKPDKYHVGKIFDFSVLLALGGRKTTALGMLKSILSGGNPITDRERETEITRSFVRCLENDQPLQPLLNPSIAVNRSRWTIRPVKPRRPGSIARAPKPTANKPPKPAEAPADNPVKPTFMFVVGPPKPRKFKK